MTDRKRNDTHTHTHNTNLRIEKRRNRDSLCIAFVASFVWFACLLACSLAGLLTPYVLIANRFFCHWHYARHYLLMPRNRCYLYRYKHFYTRQKLRMTQHSTEHAIASMTISATSDKSHKCITKIDLTAFLLGESLPAWSIFFLFSAAACFLTQSLLSFSLSFSAVFCCSCWCDTKSVRLLFQFMWTIYVRIVYVDAWKCNGSGRSSKRKYC